MRSFLLEAATIFVLLLISLHIQKIDTAEVDIISDSNFLTEKDTLVSPTGTCELGFFKTGRSSENTYLGIWYKKISVKTVIWVANRDQPLTGASSGQLRIVKPGNLVLVNNATSVFWSSNTTSSENAFVTLDDNGNLVMTEGNPKKIVWQSFDYPTDTLLPGMKLGKNLLRGIEWRLSSWKTSQDPSTSDITYSADTNGYPQYLLREGTAVRFRLGPWNGQRFSGASTLTKNNIYTYHVIMNETEVSYTYNLDNSSVLSRLTINSSGILERLVWVEDGKRWQLHLAAPKDICDTYNICGTYGSCSISRSQACSCLDDKRFVPL